MDKSYLHSILFPVIRPYLPSNHLFVIDLKKNNFYFVLPAHIFFSYFTMFYWHTFLCVTCVPGACKGQQRPSGPLELELQMVMSHQCWAVSVTPQTVYDELRLYLFIFLPTGYKFIWAGTYLFFATFQMWESRLICSQQPVYVFNEWMCTWSCLHQWHVSLRIFVETKWNVYRKKKLGGGGTHL